ncbi:unnamed protein product, partial [Urochloa humidicola]
MTNFLGEEEPRLVVVEVKMYLAESFESIDVHAACSPLARPKHSQFGPAQAQHGPLPTVLRLVRHDSRAWVWASILARGLARPDTKLIGRPGCGPLNPTQSYIYIVNHSSPAYPSGFPT